MAYTRDAEWAYFRRVLITVGVVGVAYAAWQLAGIFVLLFASVLISILLSGAADILSAKTFLSRRWALGAIVVALATVLVGVSFLFGGRLTAQVDEVFEQLPHALDRIGQQIGISDASTRAMKALSANPGGQLLSQAANLGYTLIGGLADSLLVIVTAVYLAAAPQLYQSALVKLFPPAQHSRILDATSITARALRVWFLGQLVSMILVGLLSGAAFWFIGLPSSIGLGFIAGISNFVPLVGPIVGSIPAVLVAFAESATAALWTLAVIFVIQQIEGYVITPIVQQHAANAPPAMVLFAIVAFGVLFGWPGVVFAVPMAVAVMVLVQRLWVDEVLGE